MCLHQGRTQVHEAYESARLEGEECVWRAAAGECAEEWTAVTAGHSTGHALPPQPRP